MSSVEGDFTETDGNLIIYSKIHAFDLKILSQKLQDTMWSISTERKLYLPRDHFQSLGVIQYAQLLATDQQHPSLLHVNDLVQDCSNSIANALELLQSNTKPSK